MVSEPIHVKSPSFVSEFPLSATQVSSSVDPVVESNNTSALPAIIRKPTSLSLAQVINGHVTAFYSATMDSFIDLNSTNLSYYTVRQPTHKEEETG